MIFSLCPVCSIGSHAYCLGGDGWKVGFTPPLSSQGKTPQSPSQRENVGTGGSSWAKVRPSVGRVQDRTCGTQKARFVSWLQREKLGCELCWDPGPSVSPGHGHAQSTLHSEALLLLGAPCPPDSHLLSPECRSVSPRVDTFLYGI